MNYYVIMQEYEKWGYSDDQGSVSTTMWEPIGVVMDKETAEEICRPNNHRNDRKYVVVDNTDF
jgi:hypothetical protein